MASAEIQQLKKLRGIGSEYQNSQNLLTHVSEENQTAVLQTIVADLSQQGVTQALNDLSCQQYQRTLPPICVVRQDVGDDAKPIEIPVNLPDAFNGTTLNWELESDGGDKLRGMAQLSSDKIIDTDKDCAKGFYSKQLYLQTPLPSGSHKLRVSSDDGQVNADMTLVLAPQQCYRQTELMAEQKLFGFSAQLYTLRSARNWGMGDFTDLRQFAVTAAANGVDIIGLNPMHALFPANPFSFSPYSPSNRAFLNVMYIDAQDIAEYSFSKAARALVESREFQAEIATLRDKDKVDYAWVAHCKFRVLDILFNEFADQELPENTERAQQFKLFIEEQGEALFNHATYDALHEYFLAQDESLWGWPVWPEAYRDPQSVTIKEFQKTHAHRVQYFQYLQWIAFEQLKAAQDAAVDAGMAVGIYLDLAVGVNAGGSEAWANQSLFSFQASVGAPPDALATEGQDWGFPPFEPEALRNSAYELFARNLRANMINAGAVRFDHCVSLLRLWWIPHGKSARDGAYVHYNIDEIIGMLAMESHRNKCMIVGEDLGTVPPQLPKIMEDNAIYCYRVLYFEFEENRMVPPEHYPQHSMATINTHDVAPLNSWWQGSDILLREELGVLTDQSMIEFLQRQRRRDKQYVVNAMHHYGFLTEHKDVDQLPDMTEELNTAIHQYLASSNAAVMISQLEDWMDMQSPVNVPGTFKEFDNWQRKMSKPTEEIFTDARNLRRLNAITSIRQHSEKVKSVA